MAVRMKIDPISKEDVLFLTADLSPGERSRTLAAAARENLRQAQETNRSVLGMIPPHETFVDGRAGASEDTVRPDGEIVYEFELMNEMFEWIGQPSGGTPRQRASVRPCAWCETGGGRPPNLQERESGGLGQAG